MHGAAALPYVRLPQDFAVVVQETAPYRPARQSRVAPGLLSSAQAVRCSVPLGHCVLRQDVLVTRAVMSPSKEALQCLEETCNLVQGAAPSAVESGLVVAAAAAPLVARLGVKQVALAIWGGGALVHAGMAGDLGGSSSLSAGLSSCANGGTVSLVSGVGGRQVSGVVTIVSGESERGNSGSLGVAALVGGAITLETSAASDVGHITMSARKSACARAGGVGVRRSPSGGMKLKGALLRMRATLRRCKRHRAPFFFVPVKALAQVRASATAVHVVAAL